MTRPLLLPCLVLPILVACGPAATPRADGGTSHDAGAEPDAFGIPLVVNAVYRYWVVDSRTGARDLESHTVEALEDIGGGKMAFRVRKTRLKGGVSVQYQQKLGPLNVYYSDNNEAANGALIRHDDYTPYRVRFDATAEHTGTGAEWTETYQQVETSPISGTVQTRETAMWKVLSGDATVTITATVATSTRSYSHCIQVSRTVAGATKTYWFAHGIGKVKESGGQEEELVSYSIPGR